MKKFKCFSLLLCLSLLIQCIALPVQAAETTLPLAPEETAYTSPDDLSVIQKPEEIPFGMVSIENGCRTIEGKIPVGGNDRRLETAQSVFLYEITSDTVVYSYNADLQVHPGTLAKIVLVLLVVENCERDEIVTVTEGIQSYIPMGSHDIALKSLEQLTVDDLLHAVMMEGANDAAVALAHYVAGTTGAFLEMMNNRVKMMG